jgi:hypothetical protein
VDLSVVVRIILILSLKIQSVRMLIGFNSFRAWFGGAAYMNTVLERLVSDFFFGVLLTMHLSIILANDQLDAQIFCFIISLLQSTCFEQRCAHHQEVKFYEYSIW